MTARALRLLPVLLAIALVAAAPAEAQATPPRRPQPVLRAELHLAVRPTVDRLREALAALAAVDRELMPAESSSTLRGADEATLDRRARARARVTAGLDTLLAAGPRGRAAIKLLATEWPGIDQVRRTEVRAAFLARATRPTRSSSSSGCRPPLRATRRRSGGAPRRSTRSARPADALRTRQARFELAPEDEDGWRALLRAHESAGTLPRLRDSLARLHIVYPDSRAVREHEIEVLHRLGRRDEALRLMADTLGVSR